MTAATTKSLAAVKRKKKEKKRKKKPDAKARSTATGTESWVRFRGREWLWKAAKRSDARSGCQHWWWLQVSERSKCGDFELSRLFWGCSRPLRSKSRSDSRSGCQHVWCHQVSERSVKSRTKVLEKKEEERRRKKKKKMKTRHMTAATTKSLAAVKMSLFTARVLR